MLLKYYEAMLAHFGPSKWWPGDSPFEVAVGAILTQNTSWKNVEKSIAYLKSKNLLCPQKMWQLSEEELQNAIRSSGFYRVKAKRLLNFLNFLAKMSGLEEPTNDTELKCLQGVETPTLREALLSVGGIGFETADSILLYALGRPIFVVDAYTHRLCTRHGFLPEEAGYEEMQEFFTDALPLDIPLYNEYHALIVRTLGTYCKKSSPLCTKCPLGEFLE